MKTKVVLLASESFSENISWHVFRGDVFESDRMFLECFTNKMIPNVDMLGPVMKDRVMSQFSGSSIIVIDRYVGHLLES